jgi:glycosyltransferase involved in cell wall biosynthesis
MIVNTEERSSSTLVIVATLNEEEGIGPTMVEIKSCLDEPFCLVVDGRSTDGTVKIAENMARAMGVRVVTQKVSGKGDAIATAIGHAQAIDAEYVAFVDSDARIGVVSVRDYLRRIHHGCLPEKEVEYGGAVY